MCFLGYRVAFLGLSAKNGMTSPWKTNIFSSECKRVLHQFPFSIQCCCCCCCCPEWQSIGPCSRTCGSQVGVRQRVCASGYTQQECVQATGIPEYLQCHDGQQNCPMTGGYDELTTENNFTQTSLDHIPRWAKQLRVEKIAFVSWIYFAWVDIQLFPQRGPKNSYYFKAK